MSETAETALFTVKTTAFEGPLELLLSLVEARKLFINEIALASVADDYMRHARSLPQQDIGDITSFLAIAATLILIKSRSLLPGFVVTKEEEKDIKDLESRLALYALIKEVSESLAKRFGKTIIHLPPERQRTEAVFAPDTKLTTEGMLMAVRETLGRIPKEQPLPQVRVRKIISIDVMLNSLTERIALAARTSFRQWQQGVVGEDKEAHKSNVIVSFLAMLELVRQGTLDALQNTDFEDIELFAINELQQ